MRCGYSTDCAGSELALYRGAVDRAIQGQRGQRLLMELARALDAMPEKRLSSSMDGCGLAAVLAQRGQQDEIAKLAAMEDDSILWQSLAELLDIAPSMVREIMFINDEASEPERWNTLRKWVDTKIDALPEDRSMKLTNDERAILKAIYEWQCNSDPPVCRDGVPEGLLSAQFPGPRLQNSLKKLALAGYVTEQFTTSMPVGVWKLDDGREIWVQWKPHASKSIFEIHTRKPPGDWVRRAYSGQDDPLRSGTRAYSLTKAGLEMRRRGVAS